MKNMRKRIITKAVIIAAVLMIVPMIASARGNSEKPYPEALEQEFITIAEGLEAGTLDKTEALEALHEFRAENSKENNEDYQSMEKLLTAVQSKEMTITRAREQLRLLEECQAEEPLQIREQLRTKETDDPGTGSLSESKPAASGSGTGSENKSESSGSGGTDNAKGKK